MPNRLTTLAQRHLRMRSNSHNLARGDNKCRLLHSLFCVQRPRGFRQQEVFEKLLRSSAGIPAALALMSAAACAASHATSHVLIGKARAPLSTDQVRLYLEPPAGRFEQIAVIEASSKHSFSFTAQRKEDVVIRRLKEEAAKLGANGVLLREIADGPAGSVGAGVGREYESARGTISLGLSGSGFTMQKFGEGMAIYLDAEAVSH